MNFWGSFLKESKSIRLRVAGNLYFEKALQVIFNYQDWDSKSISSATIVSTALLHLRARDECVILELLDRKHLYCTTKAPDLPASYYLQFFIKTKFFISQLVSKCFLNANRNNRSITLIQTYLVNI